MHKTFRSSSFGLHACALSLWGFLSIALLGEVTAFAQNPNPEAADFGRGAPPIAAELEVDEEDEGTGSDPSDASAPLPNKKTYRQLPVDQGLRSQRTKISNMLRDGIPAGQEAAFDDYYRKYAFALWTDPSQFPSLPSLRKALRNELYTAGGGAIYDHLNQLALDQLGAMAKSDEFHPAVRFNALLAIGDLNVANPAMGEMSKPLPAAREVLLPVFEDEQMSDTVKIGALLGLLRHVKLGVDEEAARERIASDMLKLASATEAMPGRSVEGHSWMRIRAIEALGALPSEVQPQATAKTLLEVCKETDAPFSIRAAAVEALGRRTWTEESGLLPVEAAKSLGQLAVDAVGAEIDACEQNAERTLDPRLLKSVLVSVQEGLGVSRREGEAARGLFSLEAEAKVKNYLKSLNGPLESWNKILDNKELLVDEDSNSGDRRGARRDGLGGRDRTRKESPAKQASDAAVGQLKQALKSYQKLLQQ